MNIFCKVSILTAIVLFLIPFIPNQVFIVEASLEEEVKFDRLTIEQGLPHGRVYSMIQDSYGYMWFGTEYGLTKFDGLRFTVYENSQENPLSISNNFARTIYEDSYDVIWIGTTQGLNRFNRATDTFTHYFNDPLNVNSISDNSIQFGAICEDNQGYLWIGTDNGLNRFDRATDTFIRYFHDPSDSNSISSNTIAAIYEDSYGILWVGTAYGLNRYDDKTNTFTQYLNDKSNNNSISDNSIWTINEDNQGVLWIGTDNGLNRFDRKTETFTRYFHDPDNPNSLSSSNIRIISEDSNNILWIGTTNGLNRYDRETGALTRYYHDPNDINSIPNNIISQFYEDEEQGIFWVGTWNGVAKINYYKQAFKNYDYSPGSGLNSNKVYFIYEDITGTVWIATDNGLNKLNRETKIFTYYNNDSENNNSLSNDLVFSICEESNDILWIGTTFGLNRYDRETETFTRYFYDLTNPNSLSSSNIRAVYRDSSGILWVGTTNGLNRYDSKTDTFTRYLNEPSNLGSISDNYIITIYEDSNGKLWVGTDNGLNRYNNETDTFTSYLNDLSNPNSISANSIYNIIEDSRGILWIGTNYGLNRFDLKEDVFTHYTDGLKSALILGVLEDDNGDIWVSTNNGLGRLNIDTGIFLHRGRQSGLNNIEYTSGACCKTQNGDLLFGGSNGIDYFNPNDIIINNNIVPILITGFFADGNKITVDKPIEEVDSIKLPYSDNSFTVEYIKLDYNSQINNQYMYKLEGFDELWHHNSYERNFASYTNIPAGNYTFVVKGSNSQGVWNDAGESFKITIEPPFWQQGWFILAVTIICVLLVIVLMKYVTYSANQRTQKLEVQVGERTRQLIGRTEQLEKASKELEKTNILLENQIQQRIEFTRSLVHELKTPLTSAINSSEALIDQSNNDITKRLSKNIYVSAIKLNNRINELLDLSRIEVGILSVKCRSLDLITLINEMSYNMLLEASKKEQILKFDIPNVLPMIMADEERVEQIISNLINNALKYNKRNGQVLLKVSSEKNNVIIEVRDEGMGIEEKNLVKIFEPYVRLVADQDKVSGLGIGLALTKKLVELQNGEIWVTSKVGEGSSFFVSLPIIDSHFE